MNLRSIPLESSVPDEEPESPSIDGRELEKAPVKKLFIVGCRRSGTTWTMLLLAHHPRVVALQQIDFFRRLLQFGSWFGRREDYGTHLLLSQVAPGVHVEDRTDGLARFPLDVVLSQDVFRDFAHKLAAEVYGRFAARHPDPLALVEQTPEYVQVWEEILKVFPDAYFLHVVRDPRAVFASHRNAAKSWADPLRFSWEPLSVAEEWCRDVKRARRIPKATQRYLEIRYETLRREPENGLRQILEWLELPRSDAILKKAVDACAIGKLRGSKHAPAGFFRRGEADGWRDEISRGELHALEYVAGDLMLEVGYPLELARPLAEPRSAKLRRMKRDLSQGLGRWAWNSDGPLRRGVARVLKAFPRLRRFALRKVQKPGDRRAA